MSENRPSNKRRLQMEIDDTEPTAELASDPIQPKSKTVKYDDNWSATETSFDNLLQDIDFEDYNEFPPNSNTNKAQSLDLSTWKRCRIVTIEKDPKNWNLILRVREDSDGNCGDEALCRLQGPWAAIKVTVNAIVSIVAVWNEPLQAHCVNGDAGFIVTQPDHLISGTSVVGALFCRRKGVLTDKFSGIDSCNKIMTIGSLVHELFQIVLRRRLQTLDEIQVVCDEMMRRQATVFQLYACSMTTAEARNEMEKFMANIGEFMRRYITGDSARVEKDRFCDKIDCIADIEENIWVPRLGLKGKVDVSVKIRRRNNFFNGDVKSMPLEIKTGRASFASEHRGQVTIYKMMMKEVGESVDAGLLLYLREGIMKEIPISRHDQRDLILLRNDLAHYLTTNTQIEDVRKNIAQFEAKLKTFDTPVLPEPINHHSACATCPYSTICCAFLSRDRDQQLSDRHPLRTVMNDTLKQLSAEHIDYFVQWSGLLTLEAADEPLRQTNQISNMWTKSAEWRQENGHAICDLVVHGRVVCTDETYVHEFVVKSGGQATQNRFSMHDLTLSGMHPGDYLRVSIKRRIAIAAGKVIAISKDSITMGLERNLNQRYANETFILDRSVSSTFSTFNFATLGALIENRESSAKLRSIVIDRIKPTFCKKLPNIIATVGKQILVGLNVIQQKAVLKALTANDYLLLKGLPGTGKTQTLLAIVMLYSLMGKSVLITSHTNSAVDNVLVKLLDKGMQFIRLGSASANVSPKVLPYTESALTQNCKTTEDFQRIYMDYDIVGVTCLSSSHPMLLQRRFDVCLVDEATQVSQIEVVRPLLFAEKFILVGDPEQLPPLVKSKEAKLLGADQSLFNRLDSDEATSVLTMQYRMNRVITKLANDLTYNGLLKCATDQVAVATMKIRDKDMVAQRCKSEKWLTKALSSHLDLSVVLLDVGNVFSRSIEFAKSQKEDPSRILERNFEHHTVEEIDKRTRIVTNYCEAAVCLYLVQTLIEAGVRGNTIGIIAPYRAQVELLKQLLLKYETNIVETIPDGRGIEVNTVDQYQGRDKDVIIYSCTKCDNPIANTSQLPNGKTTTDILEDQRRLTVALTRSKHKLIMIGDVRSLQVYTPFQTLFKSMTGMCKVALSDGALGFSWSTLLGNLLSILEQ